MLGYATPEWLEAVARNYRSNPINQEMNKRLGKVTFCFRIAAEPKFGIDSDLYFIEQLDDGELKELRFVTAEEGKNVATWVTAASFDVWREVIQKRLKFTTSIIQGKVKVEAGDKAGIIVRAGPVAVQLADPYCSAETSWPDAMSPDDLAAYKAKLSEFRKDLGV